MALCVVLLRFERVARVGVILGHPLVKSVNFVERNAKGRVFGFQKLD